MKLRLKVPLEDNQMPGCPCPRLITLEQRLANPATMLAHSCWLPISPPPVSQAAHIQILACDFFIIHAQCNEDSSKYSPTSSLPIL